jgi:glucose-1-phosphate thymidylyltransferase
MASVSGGVPKALLEIDGTPLICRLLKQLGPRVDKACVVISPTDDLLPRRIGQLAGSIEVTYARQPERRGVGHAVLQAEPHVEGPFIVVMGDAFYAEPLGPFVEAWLESGADGALLIEPHAGLDQPMGRVRVADGRAVALNKTPATAGFTHTLAGSLILPEAAFSALARTTKAASGEIELETAVGQMIAAGHEFAAGPYWSWRTNVNRPRDIRALEARLPAAGPLRAEALELDGLPCEGPVEIE